MTAAIFTERMCAWQDVEESFSWSAFLWFPLELSMKFK